MFRALCAHHHEVKILLNGILYRHTCRWPSGAQFFVVSKFGYYINFSNGDFDHASCYAVAYSKYSPKSQKDILGRLYPEDEINKIFRNADKCLPKGTANIS